MKRRGYWPHILFALFVGYFTLMALLTLIVVARKALAEEHVHPTETLSGAVAKFYETWMRPDSPVEVSCCNRQDCEVVDEVRKLSNGMFEAKRKSDGHWLRIPESKVEQNRDSPDGRSHMCSRGAAVFCYVHGTLG